MSAHSEVLSKQYHDDHTLIHCRLPKGAAGKLASQGLELRVLSGKLPEPSKRGYPDRATYLPTAQPGEEGDGPVQSSAEVA
ncbi:MAG: hypothetical protein ACK6A7_15165 [Planctomycetota bacterium]